MSGLLIALFAQLLIGFSLIVDKILLGNPERRKATTYVFWVGLLSFTALFLAPFGFHFPTFQTLALALGAGAIFFLGLFSYYRVLDRGEASETLTAVGAFSPIATALIASFLLQTPLNIAEKIAFGFLVAGGLLLSLRELRRVRATLHWILLAALLFGLANVLEKIVFNSTNFITGFVLMKTGTLLAALSLLLFSTSRADILSRSKETPPAHRLWYFGNRAIAGLASLLIFYAINLDHPAIVDATSGFRYAFIFIGTLMISSVKPKLLKETFTRKIFLLKVLATALVMVGILGLGVQRYYASKPIPRPSDVTWGITFSTLMSEQLGLAWKENYEAILQDLHPDVIRLVAYWPFTEPSERSWHFENLDWQVGEAEKAGIPIVLTVGQKAPRWPECHYPGWLHKNDKANREEHLLRYIEQVVDHYKNRSNLLYWQVENEPFLIFGECPPLDKSFLEKEIALVQTLDPAHQILMTDGGEFGNWFEAARRSDVFGTTLYRKVYNRFFGPIEYPLTPEFYPLKTTLTKWMTGKPDQKFFVIELGLEPWTKKQIYEISLDEQRELFGPSDFKENIDYALHARFDTYYLWGAEWWYSMKGQGHPEYWEMAKEIIRNSKSQ